MGRTIASAEDGEIEAVRYPEDLARAPITELPARMAEILAQWEAEREQAHQMDATDRRAGYDWMLSFARMVGEIAVAEGRTESGPESTGEYLIKVLRSLQESTQEMHRLRDWSLEYRDTREHLTQQLILELLDFS